MCSFCLCVFLVHFERDLCTAQWSQLGTQVQRGLKRSPFCNNYKVANYGGRAAIGLFDKHKLSSLELLEESWTLSGCRLTCHCRPEQDCHGDVIIRQFRLRYPSAYDRNDPLSAAPQTSELQYLAMLRETPESDDGSTADENAPPRGSGWLGQGPPMMVGSGYSVEFRKYPEDSGWKRVPGMIVEFSQKFRTMELLMNLAMGRVTESPFPKEAVDSVRNRIICHLEQLGIPLERNEDDRTDTPIDFRFMSE